MDQDGIYAEYDILLQAINASEKMRDIPKVRLKVEITKNGKLFNFHCFSFHLA